MDGIPDGAKHRSLRLGTRLPQLPASPALRLQAARHGLLISEGAALLPLHDVQRMAACEGVGALEAAIKVLRHPQEFGAISSAYLPYVSILPVFAALQLHAKSVAPEKQLDAQRKIRHWYWASVFNNRYSGSVESTSARDFQDVKAWIDDDTAEPSLVLVIQKERNIKALHEAAAMAGYRNILEVSTKSDRQRGQHLSAFYLKVKNEDELIHAARLSRAKLSSSPPAQNSSPISRSIAVENSPSRRLIFGRFVTSVKWYRCGMRSSGSKLAAMDGHSTVPWRSATT